MIFVGWIAWYPKTLVLDKWCIYHRKCIYILLPFKFARIENEMVGAWTDGWRNCCRTFSFNQFVWFNQWVKSILLWFLSSLKPCRWTPSVSSFASMNCSRGGRGALFGVRTGTVPCGRWLTLLCSEAPEKDTWGSQQVVDHQPAANAKKRMEQKVVDFPLLFYLLTHAKRPKPICNNSSAFEGTSPFSTSEPASGRPEWSRLWNSNCSYIWLSGKMVRYPASILQCLGYLVEAYFQI